MTLSNLEDMDGSNKEVAAPSAVDLEFRMQIELNGFQDSWKPRAGQGFWMRRFAFPGIQKGMEM